MAILHQALFESVWGKPAYSKVRQSISIFDKRMSGVGVFFRGGKGSGKLKFSLRYSAQDRLVTLLQVCDGQRLLTIDDDGEHSARAEIDLGKIRHPSRLSVTEQSVKDPVNSMYLAIGGQAEVFRKLCQQYEWTSVVESSLDAEPIWVLRGQLAEAPPELHARAEIDLQLFRENQSGLLPTQVEVAIGTLESSFPFWLYHMTLERSSQEVSSSGRATALHIVTEWPDPILLKPEQLTARLFHVSSSGGERFTDETDRYLPPPLLTASRP